MTPEELVQAACTVRKRAYAPYSHFTVGAALLCKNGKVFCGCNVENAAFTPTCCAERTAFFSAIAEFCMDDFEILLFDGKTIKQHTLKEIFPLAFSENLLNL